MDFTAGEKLTASKTNNVLQARCHAYQTSTQSTTSSVIAAITFNAEAYDPFGFHSTSVNTSRITPTIPGTYKAWGQVCWAANTTGDRTAQIYKNGAGLDSLPYMGMPSLKGTGLSFGFSFCFGTAYMDGVSDYFTLHGTQNSGGSLNTAYSSAGSNSFLIVERIGD